MPYAPGIPGVPPRYSKVTLPMAQEPPTRPGVSAGVVPPPAIPPRPRGGQRTPTPAGDRALELAKRIEARQDASDAKLDRLAQVITDHMAEERARGDRRQKVTIAVITAAAGVLGTAITVLPPLLLRDDVKAQADYSADRAARDKISGQRHLIREETERAVRKLRAEHQRGLLIDRITAQAQDR